MIPYHLEVYQHFKGGVYIKICESIHTETGEELVTYVCATSGEIFSRPKEMFYDKISRDKYFGKRFIKVPYIESKEERKKLRII